MQNKPQTPEELILQMNSDELQELLTDMGFEPTPVVATRLRSLVHLLGSLDAAIVTLHDDQVVRRAA